MTRASLSIVLSIMSLTFLLSFPATAQTQPEKWEYKKIECNNPPEAELNKHGDEGWELVSVAHAGTGNCLYFIFKRPKKEIFWPTPPAPAGPPRCNLTLAQAPVIHGIRLGMNTDELLVLFPRSKEQSRTIEALGHAEINYGEVRLRFDKSTFPENKEMFSNIYAYNMALFDGRVVRFEVLYETPPQNNRSPNWTYRTWITKLSETYTLPRLEDWMGLGESQASIACQDFRMTVNASGGSASIGIIGPPYDEQIKQRRDAASAKLRSEFKP
jgi:Domain of unknown function (DUF4177)